MKKRFGVIGSGFRGLAACFRLLKRQDAEIYLIDSAKSIGGIMNSREVNGFYVDNGVHMFDSIPQDLGEIVTEIMEGQVSNIDFISESALNGQVTEGFSLPDLSCLPLDLKKK